MMTSSFNFKGTKSPNILKILETADIHLGHQRTPSESTLEALDRVINPKTLKDLDVLLIAGDFFDHLLQFPDDRVLKIEAWVCQLLLLCKKFDVVLRVLEGTGSHDCKQSRIFVNLNSSAAINADVKYIDKISVEVIERFGISVLYVPDNQGHNDSVWQNVQTVLLEAGLKQVDFAVMHGFFEFQIPFGIQDTNAHIQARYESIVRYTIFIGHHHTHRLVGKVAVSGSINRHVHGEEEAKGSLLATYTPSGLKTMEFVVNPKAKVYKTLEMREASVEDIMRKLDSLDLPYDSAIRLSVNSTDPICTVFREVSMRYPQYELTLDREKSKQLDERIESIKFSYEPITITKDNIRGLLMERMVSKLSQPDLKACMRLLTEVL